MGFGQTVDLIFMKKYKMIDRKMMGIQQTMDLVQAKYK